VFQSPSLRGSGRFAEALVERLRNIVGFNPLHCGAVVASKLAAWREAAAREFQSPSLRGSGRFAALAAWREAAAREFQSPSLRGSGRFRGALRRQAPRSPVSIPFIAGQWSLHRRGGADRRLRRGVSIPFIAGQWSLHHRRAAGPGAPPGVSIPFIAGQWSLLRNLLHDIRCAEKFQSPSLRGSGRFRSPKGGGAKEEEMFQSPSLRGSGRFSPHGGWARRTHDGFNPLHCGAVVASGPAKPSSSRSWTFQSPSLRGSGRFRQSIWSGTPI